MSNRVDYVVRWLLIVGTFFLAAILVLNLWILMGGRGQTIIDRAERIEDQAERIEDQLAYISCLLLIEPSERTPELVASCQVNPESDG